MSGWRSNVVFFEISITLAILLDVSVVVLNGLIAHVLKRNNKTIIITFWFIYCLSISDVMVGVVDLVRNVVSIHSFVNKERVVFRSTLATTTITLSDYFLSLSGRMILVIAVDRCIHMKYLIKYSMIMTRSRARAIMLLNILFGIALVIPPLLSTGNFVVWFYVGLNIFHITGTLMIYVVYIKTYFTVKRQVAGLKIDKRNPIAVLNKSDDKSQYSEKSVKVLEPNSCVKLERYQGFHTNRDEDNGIHEHKQGAFVLSVPNAFNPPNMDTSCNSMEFKTNCSNYVESLETYPNGELPMEHEKRMKSKLPNTKQELKNKIIKKMCKRKANPELEFRKATCMILLSLSVCYMPIFINNFYRPATRGQNYTFSFIAHISLILNSSLNALILIVCNKEIKKNIKAIFRHC